MIRVVAIGGGHGLSATLRAARLYAGDITAIVSVADDGGSSGRLRNALGIPAPGDLRRCLTALADPDSIWGRAFEHRFEEGELAGHPVGNLVIAGLAAVTGDFTRALDEAGRLVGAAGRVLPATEVPVVLKAESAIGTVEGQVKVSEAGRISAVSLVPPDAASPAAAIAAIEGADQVVLGPGSLFTSIIAAAAVPDIRAALDRFAGPIVYVCNLRPQSPETDGYDAEGHVQALIAHGINPTVMVCDETGLRPADSPIPCVCAAVANPSGTAHDEAGLAAALRDLVV